MIGAPSGDVLLCDGIAAYAAACADPARPSAIIPVIDSHGTGAPAAALLDWAGWAERIAAAHRAAGAPAGAARAVVVGAANGPAALCAAFLAAATGRALRLVARLDDAAFARRPHAAAEIVVACAADVGDALLLATLDRLTDALAAGLPWDALPCASLVTGRDLAALSRLVGKLVVAARQPLPERVALRHYAPEDHSSLVTELACGAGEDGITVDGLHGAELRASYERPVHAMAFRTHGSEACAKGGAGTVLCGLHLRAAEFEPLAQGVLACGRGVACPRGPHPVPLYRMAADVLMLGSCNGLRLADSLTRPEFNFALAFVDGPGTGFVSSIFSSVGADLASHAFLAAMADGRSIGEATVAINALVHHAGLERTSYVAIGDVEQRLRAPVARAVSAQPVQLPATLELGDAHFAELRILDPALVEQAQRGDLALAVTAENGGSPFGFQRVAATGDGAALSAFLFGFPHPLGRVRIAAAGREQLRERARTALAALAGWVDTWRLLGLDAALPEAYDDLRAGRDELAGMLARSLALVGVDGATVARIEHQLRFATDLAAAASAGVMEHVTPQLEGSFWLSNMLSAEYRLQDCETIPCGHCDLRALRRTVRHALSDALRIVVVCPRCGICSDVAAASAIESVTIGAPPVVGAGQRLSITVTVQLARDAVLDVHPRLSTHGEPAPPPVPASVTAARYRAGEVRLDFSFALPPGLSAHRHYVKVLLATADGLAFASRPFFVA